jgi:hypothetical protein
LEDPLTFFRPQASAFHFITEIQAMASSDHNSLTSCNDEPVVGGIFNGCVITKVEVEVSDRGSRLKKRFLLTLEGGMMAIDDRYVPKSAVIEVDTMDNDASCSSFHSFTFEGMALPESAKGINALKEQQALEQREKEERRKKRQDKEKRKGPSPKAKGDKVQSINGTIRNGAKPGKSQSEDTIVVDNTTTASVTNRKKVAVVSKITKVVPESDPATNDDGPRATWRFPNPVDIPVDVDLWAAVDVCLLPTGKDVDFNADMSDENPKDLKGVWGYVQKSSSRQEKPPSSSSSLKSSSSSSSRPSSFRASKDVWVYPPNVKPPPDFPVHGTYKFAPLKIGKKKTKFTWPPPIDPIKKKQQRVNRLKELPKIFSNSPAMPLPIQAYSSKNEPTTEKCDPLNPNDKQEKNAIVEGQELSDTGLIGVWTYLDGQEQKDDEWVAQDVILLPPGQSPLSSNGDGDNDLPQGTWVIFEDDTNDSSGGCDTIMQPHNPKKQWIDSSRQPKVHLFAPGQKPDVENAPVIASGTWTYAKDALKRKWPPPTKEEVKKLHNVGKVNIPRIFQQKSSRPLTVFSKDCPKCPKNVNSATKKRSRTEPEDTAVVSTVPQQVESSVTGQWTFFDGENAVPYGEWEPVNVVIYAPDEAPPSKIDVQGIWTIHDADPDQICVHAPGFELDSANDSVLVSGVWAFHNGDDDMGCDDAWLASWPPPNKIGEADALMTETKNETKWAPPGKVSQEDWTYHRICVFSETTISAKRRNDMDATVAGIWKYNDAPPENFEEWLPQDLMIYREGHLPPNSANDNPTGIWGIHKGSEPDEDGVWAADEVWFFPPGEEVNVPEDCDIQGKWAYPPGKKKIAWPPKSNQSKEEKGVLEIAKLPGWDPNGHGDAWKPQKVSVVPKGNTKDTGTSSDPIEGTPNGIWVFSDGQEPKNIDDWNVMKVVVYPKGEEPVNSDGRPTGVWGYHKDAIPVEDEGWAVEAVVFCAPGVEPSDDIVVQGQWAFFDDDAVWPQDCDSFQGQELLPEDIKRDTPKPKMVAKKPIIVPEKALLSPMDRAKMRVLPVKSPEKNPMDEEKHVALLGEYQSAFDVANRPKKPASHRSLLKKKYKK